MKAVERILKVIFFTSISFACWASYLQLTQAPAIDDGEALPGGSATLTKLNQRSYIVPSADISIAEQMPYWVGHSFFRDPWVVSPASTTARDGLGPLFNARSCIACHINGGRGALPDEESKAPVALIMKLGRLEGDKSQGNLGDPIYGNQLQVRSIDRSVNKGLASIDKSATNALFAEGSVSRKCQFIDGQFHDGETYSLCQPEYQVTNLMYGPLAKTTNYSARLAPPILGLGLLEKISAEQILSLQDIDDKDTNGVSGKANWVFDFGSQKNVLGRFGFKASQPTVAQQTAAAFKNDMGITNPIFEIEECTAKQIQCGNRAQQDKRHAPLDINSELFAQVVNFTENLAVPKTRHFNHKRFTSGRRVFYRLECDSCHTPSFEIAINDERGLPLLQKIWPYSDLLLHDMGAGLADNLGEYLANGSEWRTPPLWGLGLQQKITGVKAFLHDGRARTLQEAILWHGGEAENHKRKFLKLSKADRKLLIQFLQSI